jgi:hypothetical protein
MGREPPIENNFDSTLVLLDRNGRLTANTGLSTYILFIKFNIKIKQTPWLFRTSTLLSM